MTDFRLQRLHPDYYSSRATAVNGHYLVGRSAPPQPLTNLNVAVVGGAAMLRWDLPADLDVQYGGWIEFRHTPQLTGAQFQNTVSIGRGINGDQTHVYLPLLPGSYFAVACDSGGRASTPVSVSTRQASVLAFTPVDELVEDPLFLGARSYCQVTDGVLQLSDADFDLVANVDALPDWDAGGTGIASAGTYDFSAGMDLGAVRCVRLTAHIRIEAVNQNDLWDLRSGTIDDWPDIDGTAGAAIDASLWGRLTDDDPAGNPAWGPLMRIDSAEVQTRAIGEIECRLHSRDATFNLRLSELRLKADEVR